MSSMKSALALGMLLLLLPLAASAFKVDTHLWVGQQVIDDLKGDGSLDFILDGKTVSIAPYSDVSDAILRHPGVFLAGNMGPDAFPDPFVGQMVVHPGSGGRDGQWNVDDWLAWLIEEAENGSNKSTAALAFAYGYQAHAAADIFAHTYVNHYSGRPFEIGDNEPHSEVRHILLESLISEYTPSIGKEAIAAVDAASAADFIRESLIFNPKVAEQYLTAATTGGPNHLRVVYEMRRQLNALLESEKIDKVEQEVAKWLWDYYVSGYVEGFSINNEQAQKLIDIVNKANGYNYDLNQYIQGIKHQFNDMVREHNEVLHNHVQSEIDQQIAILDSNIELHDKLAGVVVEGYCSSDGKVNLTIALTPQASCYQANKKYEGCVVSSSQYGGGMPLSYCEGYLRPKVTEACSSFLGTEKTDVINNIYWTQDRRSVIAECRMELEAMDARCLGVYGKPFDHKCVSTPAGYDGYGRAKYDLVADLPGDNSVCWHLSANERVVVNLPADRFAATGIMTDYLRAKAVAVQGGPQAKSWLADILDPGGIIRSSAEIATKLHETIFSKTLNLIEPVIALDRKIAQELGIPYPENLVCDATKLAVSIDGAVNDTAYYLAKIELESVKRKLTSVKEIMEDVASLGEVIDDGVASLHPRDWNPVRAHAIWWIEGLNEAMSEYVKANGQVLANSVSASVAHDKKIEPLKLWLCNYRLALLGTTAAISKGACRSEAIAQSLSQEIRELRDILGVEYLIDEQVDRLLMSLEDDAKELVIKEIERHIQPEYLQLYKLLTDPDLKGARLAQEIDTLFSRDVNSTGLLKIPSASARIKAEMFGSGAKFDPQRYAVAYNSVVMAKLTLLDEDGLLRLLAAAGVSLDTVGDSLRYNGPAPAYPTGVLFNGVRSIDGSFQWMGVAPPFPRSAGFSLNQEANVLHKREFGYRDEAGNSQMFIWGNEEARRKLFRKIFKGPIAPGIDSPLSGFSAILPSSYPFKMCASNPFPDGEADKRCILVVTLIPILGLLLN